MTLLVRDEADVVDSHLAFHLNAGVDYVVATDHRSQDGTTEILDRYARDGRLHLIREEDVDYREVEWRTRMAQIVATELGADWVIHSDADEFWWPRGRDLKEVLAAIPAGYGLVRAFWRPFVLRTGGRCFLRGAHDRAALRTGGGQRPSEPVSPECESDTSA